MTTSTTRAWRLGTRGSALARAQTQTVADAVRNLTGHNVELVAVTTHGDVSRESLSQIGGTGVFVSALRDAVLSGDVDFAVHSLKDLPTAAPSSLTLAAVPARADARDVLISRDDLVLSQLPSNARVGTGSPRRAAQLRALRPDVTVVDLRGNVDTRIGKVHSGELDAVVLAAAGLVRLGREEAVSEWFDLDVMVPAPGQGALAVETRDDLDQQPPDLVAALAQLDDADTRTAVTAERSVLAAMEAGCSAPVGAHAVVTAHELTLSAFVGATGERHTTRMSLTAPVAEAESAGRQLAAALLDAGAVVA